MEKIEEFLKTFKISYIFENKKSNKKYCKNFLYVNIYTLYTTFFNYTLLL